MLKECKKAITFHSYDDSYRHIDKVSNFIQQLDATFGGEDFMEFFTVHHISIFL